MTAASGRLSFGSSTQNIVILVGDWHTEWDASHPNAGSYVRTSKWECAVSPQESRIEILAIFLCGDDFFIFFPQLVLET